jgi:quercetin dioxygenase-like cupin family protein
LAKGGVTVEVEGVRTEYKAPACINILAGQHHTITAHEDSVWFCIHATQETDADKIDEVLIGG